MDQAPREKTASRINVSPGKENGPVMAMTLGTRKHVMAIRTGSRKKSGVCARAVSSSGC
jgi:hypothetical protein